MSLEKFRAMADELNNRVPTAKTRVSKEQIKVRGLTAQDILLKARIDKGYINATINDFEDVGLKTAMPNEYGIYIWGGIGRGKTHYSWGVYKKLLLEKFMDNEDLAMPSTLQSAIDNYIYFARSSEIMDRIYDTFNNRDKKSDVIRRYVSYSVLVIDDLMAQSVSDYAHQCFLEIFDERMSKHKITVVTSNVNKEAIGLKNERLGSRLKLLETLYIGGIDRRQSE